MKCDSMRPIDAWPQEDIVQSLHALYGALNTPELVDQQLLINFISVIIRFVENAGMGYAFSKAFMDKAIRVYRQAGFSPIELYQEKAGLLRLNELESAEREQALLEAKRYAESSEDAEMLLRVLLSCAVYYTEVSQYRNALQACQESEQLIQSHHQLQKYQPRLLTFFGMNYTPLFKYRQAKNCLLQAKALLDADRRDEGIRLLSQYLIQVLSTPFKMLKRTPHTVMGAGTLNATLTTCICPLHQLPASSNNASSGNKRLHTMPNSAGTRRCATLPNWEPR